MAKNSIEPVKRKELDCLIRWPEGSVGWSQESEAIDILYDLCKKNGYGRINQIMSQIHKVWDRPDLLEYYKKEQKESAEFIRKCREIDV